MDITTELLKGYSLETILLIVIGVAFSLRALSEVVDYFYNKLKQYFNIKTSQEKEQISISDGFVQLNQGLKDVCTELQKVQERQKRVEEQLSITKERMQENTRSYIIDAHHKFCYELKTIDDYNLASLERRYAYYKANGGDTFVDTLMEELRELPRTFISKQEEYEREEEQWIRS